MSFLELLQSAQFYRVGYFTGFVSTLGMAIFVGLAKPRQPEARLWAIFSFFVSLWFLGRYGVVNTSSPEDAFFWQRVLYLGAIPLNVIYFHFVLAFTRNRYRLFLWTGYVIVTLLVVLNFTTHLFVVEMLPRGSYGLFEKPGPIYLFHTLNYFVYPGVGLYLLTGTRRNVDQSRRNQIDYIIFATGIGFLCGLTTFPGIFGIVCPPVGGPLVPIYAFIIFYAIFKHQLLDIRLVIRRTLFYSVLSAILIGLYVGLISIFTRALEKNFLHASSFSSAIAAAVIALLFHPLQVHLQRWLDRRFPRESLDQTLLREATSDFVHEIKQPLANISMPAQLALMDLKKLGDHPAIPELRERLEFILRESLEAGETVEAIRALSSPAERSSQVVDLEIILRKILERENDRIVRENIEVVREIENSVLIVKGDVRQLQIALANILKNAIDALREVPKGSRRLRVSVETLSDSVRLMIEDSGPGIGKADVGKLFDPWFSTKGSAGMGIGLFLTREILKLHHATIDVQSREGEGSVFCIVFPAAKTVSD